MKNGEKRATWPEQYLSEKMDINIFYYICPTNTQYMLTITCFLQHCYMFQCLHIIPRESYNTC